jgi:hypothetical protein
MLSFREIRFCGKPGAIEDLDVNVVEPGCKNRLVVTPVYLRLGFLGLLRLLPEGFIPAGNSV